MISVYPADYAYSNRYSPYSNGLLVLNPISCTIKEERNLGTYEATLELTKEQWLSYKSKNVPISVNMLIGIDIEGQSYKQFFRINKMVYEEDLVKISAKHVVFDLEQCIMKGLSFAATVSPLPVSRYISLFTQEKDLLGNYFIFPDTHLTKDSSHPYPIFELSTTYPDTETISPVSIDPASALSAVKKVAQMYGLEIKRTGNTSLSFQTPSYNTTEIIIRYGLNIQDIKKTVEADDMCSHLYALGKNNIYLGSLVNADITYSGTPFYVVKKFTQNIEKGEGQSEADYESVLRTDLRRQAEEYVLSHCTPAVSYDVDAYLKHNIHIGDAVRLIDETLDTDLQNEVATINGYTYDAILNEYTSVSYDGFSDSLTGLYYNVMTQTKDYVDTRISELLSIIAELKSS